MFMDVDCVRMSDFALANGCEAARHINTGGGASTPAQIYTRDAAANGVYAWDHREGQNDRAPNVITTGILPVLQDAEDRGFNVECHDGENVLTYHNRVCFYPQTRVHISEYAPTVQFNHTATGTNPKPYVHIFRREKEKSAFSPSRYTIDTLPTYEIDGKFYTKMETANYTELDNSGITFRDGTALIASTKKNPVRHWFRHEPIRAKTLAGGTIVLCDVLFNAIFEKEKTFKDKKKNNFNSKFDTDDFLIGKFLHEDFLTDVEKIAVELNVVPKSFIYTVEPVKKAASFKFGDLVKIKCEGRVGTIKSITADIATLNVDGKQLKYRLGDLTPTF